MADKPQQPTQPPARRGRPRKTTNSTEAVARPQGIPQQRPMGKPIQYATVEELAQLKKYFDERMQKSSKTNAKTWDTFWDEHFKPLRKESKGTHEWVAEEQQRRTVADARARRAARSRKAVATRVLNKLKGMRPLRKDRR